MGNSRQSGILWHDEVPVQQRPYESRFTRSFAPTDVSGPRKHSVPLGTYMRTLFITIVKWTKEKLVIYGTMK